MALYKVDSVSMPDPDEWKPILNDADQGSFRTANAKLKRKRVRTDIRKFAVVYKYITATDLATVLSAIDGESFTLTFYDVKTNTETTGTFYASQKDVETLKVDADGTRHYKNFSFRLIEY